MRQYIYLIILITFPAILPAQDITGVWEGRMDDEILQLNIEQKGNELCGYTYDYTIGNPDNHCRAIFSGEYDAARKEWNISGDGFLENVGGHQLMRIKMWQEPLSGDTLWIRVRIKNFAAALFGLGTTYSYLLKTSATTDIRRRMRPCFPEEEKTDKPIRENFIPKNDTVMPINPPAIDSSVLSHPMIKRRQVTQSRLTVGTTHINLKLYDNGVVDNDTISIFYNGRLLVSHQRLSEKPVELNIELDENAASHEITLFAENLGGIPPNTALVVVTAGTRRYELRSSASLEENAVLQFEYRKE